MDNRRNMRSEMKTEVSKSPMGQNLYIESRQKARVSGVLNVESFNDLEILLETELGMLTIKGANLHMSKLNLETKELAIEGSIDSCTYSEKQDFKTKSAGILSKLFK